MDAVDALYSERDAEVAEAIVHSLSRQIFDSELPDPANRIRRRVAKSIYRILKVTTRQQTKTDSDGNDIVAYHNPILKRSGHPYAMTLLKPSNPSTTKQRLNVRLKEIPSPAADTKFIQATPILA